MEPRKRKKVNKEENLITEYTGSPIELEDPEEPTLLPLEEWQAELDLDPGKRVEPTVQ